MGLRRVQVMALSATYTPALLEDLEPLMKRPQRVMLCEESVALNAVAQFYRLFDTSSSEGEPVPWRSFECAPECVRVCACVCVIGCECSGPLLSPV